MKSIVNSSIEINVKPKFEEYLVRESNGLYLFSYDVHITNRLEVEVQLIDRYWKIFDSLQQEKIVQGKGVIGLQPILKPGQHFNYQSACYLSSTMGQMQGYYTFQNLETGKYFDAAIPAFKLLVPFILN
jgi:ApaG protein